MGKYGVGYGLANPIGGSGMLTSWSLRRNQVGGMAVGQPLADHTEFTLA